MWKDNEEPFEEFIEVEKPIEISKEAEVKEFDPIEIFKKIDEPVIEKPKKIEAKPFIATAEDEMIICVCVDGSAHSDYSFDIAVKDFNNLKNVKFIVCHIYNSAMDDMYNFQNKKDTVIEKYSQILLNYSEEKFKFITEDKSSKIHALEQILNIGKEYNIKFLVTGYYGIKGQRGSNIELTKGVDYLLEVSKVPTILMKFKTSREASKEKRFRWLFIFDKQYFNCFSTFHTFLPLISKSDYIYGLGLMPTYINYDDIKGQFEVHCKKNKINDHEYESYIYCNMPTKYVLDKINFQNNNFDFVVFYNNPSKYRNDPESVDFMEIIKKAGSNICFLNG